MKDISVTEEGLKNLIGYLLEHESDIADSEDDFYDLFAIFVDLLKRKPISRWDNPHKIGAKVKILDRAVFGQDHQFYRWEADDDDPVFTVRDVFPGTGRLKLVAPGYGDIEGRNYGNGAIYIGADGVLEVNEEVRADPPR